MVTSRMTTVQESLTDAIPPFPFFIENPAEPNRADLPTNKDNNNQFASDDQVVERQKGVPITPLLAHEKVSLDANPLPERCQFFFSDGRQCRMARSEIHPSRCPFHAEREDQWFGDPSPGGYVVGRALDLPELYSACRDLTTAAGVNRALAQVFRLLAQRRISRQEAATFGHLAQLLLRTISAMRVLAGENPAANVYQQDELRGVDKDHQELSPDNKVAAFENGARADSRLTPRREANAAPASCAQADDATSIVIPSDRPERGISPAPPVNIVTPLLAHKKVALSPLSSSRESHGHQELSRVNEVHAASPPNSQLSKNEQMCGTRLQLAQNEHLPNFST